jgi:hypothetical protein
MDNRYPEKLWGIWVLSGGPNNAGSWMRSIEEQGDPIVMFKSREDAQEHLDHWAYTDTDAHIVEFATLAR